MATPNGEHHDAIRVALLDDEDLVGTGFRMVLGVQPDIEVAGEAKAEMTRWNCWKPATPAWSSWVSECRGWTAWRRPAASAQTAAARRYRASGPIA